MNHISVSSNCALLINFFICFVVIQVIAIAMDVFTDVDIFKEVVDASIRGVPVYILLDHFHFRSFLAMTANLDIQIQKLRVSHLSFMPTLQCALIIDAIYEQLISFMDDFHCLNCHS